MGFAHVQIINADVELEEAKAWFIKRFATYSPTMRMHKLHYPMICDKELVGSFRRGDCVVEVKVWADARTNFGRIYWNARATRCNSRHQPVYTNDVRKFQEEKREGLPSSPLEAIKMLTTMWSGATFANEFPEGGG